MAVDNTPFHYTIISSKRAKNIRITIKNGFGVKVTKPWFVPKFIVNTFIRKHSGWIKNKLKQVKYQKKINQNDLYYLGKKYEIKFKPGKNQILFRFPHLFLSAYSETAGQRELRKYLKSQSKKAILKTAYDYAQKMKLIINSIKLKDQQTRWGSCSCKKNLNFNWRLIMAPSEVLRYVVIHELAHLVHLNHSIRFWELVEQYDPDFRDSRRWLKRNEGQLKQLC